MRKRVAATGGRFASFEDAAAAMRGVAAKDGVSLGRVQRSARIRADGETDVYARRHWMRCLQGHALRAAAERQALGLELAPTTTPDKAAPMISGADLPQRRAGEHWFPHGSDRAKVGFSVHRGHSHRAYVRTGKGPTWGEMRAAGIL